MGRGKSVGNEKWKNKFWPPFSCGFANMAYFEFCGPVRNHVDFLRALFFGGTTLVKKILQTKQLNGTARHPGSRALCSKLNVSINKDSWVFAKSYIIPPPSSSHTTSQNRHPTKDYT